MFEKERGGGVVSGRDIEWPAGACLGAFEPGNCLVNFEPIVCRQLRLNGVIQLRIVQDLPHHTRL